MLDCRFISAMAAAHVPAVQAVTVDPAVASELFRSPADAADLANSLCIAAACGPGTLALEPELQLSLVQALRCAPKVGAGRERGSRSTAVLLCGMPDLRLAMPLPLISAQVPFSVQSRPRGPTHEWAHSSLPCPLFAHPHVPAGAARRSGRCLGAADGG